MLAIALPAACAHAAPVPDGAEWREESIESSDGTRLHVDVFRPVGGGRTPVILIPSRYFATGTGADPRPPRMLEYYDDLHARAYERGYSVVQLTPRGYGKSGGCTDWRGAGERADVVSAIRWAARQPWSTGKVATYGLSYDGALIVAALSERVPEHAAAVPIGAPTSAYRGFYMRRVRYQPFATLQPPYTLLYTFPPADPSGVGAALLAAETRLRNPGCVVEATNWANADPEIRYWRERDYEDELPRTDVPTMWSQGLLDWSVHADGLAAVWPRLRAPKRLWLAQHPHLVPSEWERGRPDVVGREGWTEEVFRFLDRHVRGASPPRDPAVVVQEGFEGRWRDEPEWPPADARDVQLPVLPGSYTDGPGNKGEPYCMRTEAHCVPGNTGVGSWTLTPPLPHDAHLSGVPRLRVAAGAAGANVVALLYDVDEHGRAALITRGAALAAEQGESEVELYAQDWLLRRGHRAGLLLAGTDDWWFEPGRSGARVEVAGGTLTLPFLAYRRTPTLSGGSSQAIRERATFEVGADVLAQRTTRATPPPPLRAGRPRSLRLSVRPKVVRARRSVTLRVRVRAGGRPLRGARVRVARARARTNRTGRAVLRMRPHRAGRLKVRAHVRGLGYAKVIVRVRP
ncbi:MAG: CocE/NonD family hydrolase [Actinomycetota bacterium]|nr:CocE/NonD family hydrolase [Actinomycetota bacterium]